MDNIKSNTPESKLEKKLYANLLTIMGKFLAGNKSSPLYQFRNVSVVLTAESLYKSALSIYPGHEVQPMR